MITKPGQPGRKVGRLNYKKDRRASLYAAPRVGESRENG